MITQIKKTQIETGYTSLLTWEQCIHELWVFIGHKELFYMLDSGEIYTTAYATYQKVN